MYFTFDDGPDSSVTGRVLDTLDNYGAKATFFVVGTNVDSHPTVARRIVAEGHAIANQSYSHPRLTTLSDASVLSQFTRASAAITNATGIVPSCYRPPYGSVNARVHSLASDGESNRQRSPGVRLSTRVEPSSPWPAARSPCQAIRRRDAQVRADSVADQIVGEDGEPHDRR